MKDVVVLSLFIYLLVLKHALLYDCSGNAPFVLRTMHWRMSLLIHILIVSRQR